MLSNLTNDDIIAIQREACRLSLAEFVRQAWHVVEPAAPYIHGWHIDAVCEHLEAVSAGDINRLLINIPPGPMRHDSLVETDRGQVLLRDVAVGDRVLTHRGRYRRVSAVHEQGTLPILRIVTHSGRETFAAPTHPYLTPDGWVEAGKLRVGDVLAVVTPQEDRTGSTGTSPEEARFLGYIVGDGSVTQALPIFTNGEFEVIEDFRTCAASLGFETTVTQRGNHWTVRVLGGESIRSYMRSVGLQGKSSYTKRIPEAVRNGSIEVIRNFIGAYWTCDGGFDVRKTGGRGSRFRAYATTVSRELADDLVQLLGLLGIESRRRDKARALSTVAQPGGVYRSFSVEVQRECMTARFAGMPGLCSRKQALAELCAKSFPTVLWDDPITIIEMVEPARCLCLTVEDDHSFTCSGIAVKNTMKSLLCGVFWPAWEWGPRDLQSTRYVTASHSQDFSTRDTLKMRRLVSSDWYQTMWAVPLTKDQNEKTKFENERTGFRQAMAMKSLTGTRGDRVLLDDPHSVEGALSEAERANTIRVFTETVPTRLNNPEKSAIVVVMQRIHEQDVSGYILSNDLGYVHLCLPMEFEPSRRCVTSIGFTDPRTEEGELLFPERFPKDVVARDKRVMGSHAVAGQFQQRPSPRGGGIIKGEWFGKYKILPPIKNMLIFADTAQKTKEANDYSVFQCWGLGDDGRLYLIDQIRGKWEAPDLSRMALSFWQKHKARKMCIEDKSSGTGLIQDMKRNHRIPIEAIQRSTDKLTRVLDATPHIESGYVMLPESAPWLPDFLHECESFTAMNTHMHDDQIDPMADAIDRMLRGKGGSFLNLRI